MVIPFLLLAADMLFDDAICRHDSGWKYLKIPELQKALLAMDHCLDRSGFDIRFIGMASGSL